MFQTVDRPYVMWFDDDSFLQPEAGDPTWLDSIDSRLREPDVGMLGGVYHQRLKEQRRQWLERHPKYRGMPLHPMYEYFVTGGWWTAKMDLLRELEWPQTDLYHNGGDRLLGTLMTQAGYRLSDYRRGVAINADAQGVESAAPRRGIRSKGLGD